MFLQLWNKTLFYELEASSYRWKNSVLWPSKYVKMRLWIGAGSALGRGRWESRRSPHQLVSIPQLGARHSAPLLFFGGGESPSIILSRHIHSVSKNVTFYFCDYTVKCLPISIIFSNSVQLNDVHISYTIQFVWE